jgi:hypothetical protein
MGRGIRARLLLLMMSGAACLGHSAPEDVSGFLVIRRPPAQVGVEGKNSSTAAKEFIPEEGRILPSSGKAAPSAAQGEAYRTLLDNGRGEAASGWVSTSDSVFFKYQEEAEAFLAEERRKQKSSSRRTGGASSSPAKGGAHGSHATSNSKLEKESRARVESDLVPLETLQDAKSQLSSIQGKLKKALGPAFVRRVKKDWEPSSEDRQLYIEAIEKNLEPKERAFFALVSTAFAEDRQMASGDEKVEDPQGRARMLFTMKIVETRANSGFARQFMDRDQLKAGELERMWGVMTQERQFSSWNAGSSNFGNTINAMLGLSDEEQNARDRALAAYRDFSLSKVSFEGFEGKTDGATLMLNRKEVRRIDGFMKRPLTYRRKNPRSIVPWTVESIMHNPRFKSGIHQVALRVSEFSIALPKSATENDYVRVRAEDIGHWPAYLHNVHSRRMEDARKSQGAWR